MSKKIINPLIMILLALILVSCASPANETTDTTNSPTSREISDDLQLMMGTILLDKTAYAVDADQAAELLPLWKVLNTLTGSESAAQVEVDAVITSIQDAMTAEQMAAIDEMDLTMADMAEVFEVVGIEMPFGGRFGELTEEQQATMEAMQSSGEEPPEGFGGGMGPGGGMGLGGGGGMGTGGGEFAGDTGITPEMRETAMAERGSTGRGFGINTQLLEAVITFLEAK